MAMLGSTLAGGSACSLPSDAACPLAGEGGGWRRTVAGISAVGGRTVCQWAGPVKPPRTRRCSYSREAALSLRAGLRKLPLIRSSIFICHHLSILYSLVILPLYCVRPLCKRRCEFPDSGLGL